MKITLLSVYLLAILFETCTETFPTAVIHATSQSWSGGPAGSGHGTNYYIYLRAGDIVNFEFDSLWVNNKRLVAEIRTKESNSDTTVVQANDDVRAIMPDGEPNPNAEPEVIPPPIETGAKAILGFHLDGKRGYIEIAKWTTLAHIAYP